MKHNIPNYDDISWEVGHTLDTKRAIICVKDIIKF